MAYAVSNNQENKVRICIKGYDRTTERYWQVTDTYSSGTSYVNTPLDLPFEGEQDWTTSAGYNKHDLGNLVSTKFTYSGEFTQAEKETIEWSWEQHRQADVLVCYTEYRDLGWETSYPKLVITAPFVVEQVKYPKLDLTYPEIRV